MLLAVLYSISKTKMQFSGKIIRQHELVLGDDAIKVAPVGLKAPVRPA